MLLQRFLRWRWVMCRALQNKHWGHDFRPDRPHTRARRNFCQNFLNFFFQIFWLNVPNFDRKYEKMFFFVFQAKKQSKEEFVKFWRSAEISAWIWTNLSSDDFFFENSKFQFSNRRHFRYNLYFFMGLKYVWKVSRVFSYLQKFLPKPPTNQNKPNQKLEKIEKNEFSIYRAYGRNFCSMTEISANMKILHTFRLSKPISCNLFHKP